MICKYYKRVLLAVLMFFFPFINNFAQEFSISWQKQFGSISYDEGLDLVLDKDGNIYFIGTISNLLELEDTTLVPLNGESTFLTKIDTSGNILWVKNFQNTGTNKTRALEVDNENNLVICGQFSDTLLIDNSKFIANGNKDAFVAKFDSEGNMNWFNYYGGIGFDSAADISINSNNEIVFVGRYLETIIFPDTTFTSAGSWDYFVVKIDNEGEYIWSNSFRGSGFDRAIKVSFTENGDILVGGLFTSDLSDGNVTLSTIGGSDIFLQRINKSGSPLWLKSAGSANYDQLYGLDVNAENVFITGLIDGEAYFDDLTITSVGGSGWDVYVASYDLSGNAIWVNGYGSTGGDQGRSLKIDNNGSILVSGMIESEAVFSDTTLSGFGNEDAYFMSLTTEGELIDLFSVGSAGSEISNSVIKDNSGNYYLTGKFQDEMVFDGDTITTHGDNDIFLAKIQKNDFVAIEFENIKTDDFVLYQNYPNPFSAKSTKGGESSTTIKFSIPTNDSNDHCQLTIYNSLGQQVAELLNKPLAEGNYEIEFRGENLPNGIYFYRLQSGTFAETKKMILLK